MIAGSSPMATAIGRGSFCFHRFIELHYMPPLIHVEAQGMRAKYLHAVKGEVAAPTYRIAADSHTPGDKGSTIMSGMSGDGQFT